tara:strand:- start:5910 stop:6893 length:984 start_codon:yes stop_codon:yes gene_type:complete
MPKVSVIIPIYNVEKYLSECLNSVCAQTLEDIEIICVNDRSPDNCLDIVNQYSKQDSRIKVIDREKNGGLSAARNSGIDVAVGEYIYFLDSDDWIDKEYLQKMYNKAIYHNVDILLNNNMISFNEQTGEKRQLGLINGIKNQEGELLDPKFSISNTIWSSCCRLYKRTLLETYNIRFPEGYIYEDVYFKSITELFVDKTFVFYGDAYHYRIRENSIITGSTQTLEKHIKIWHLIYSYYKENDLFDEYGIGFIIWNKFRDFENEDAFNAGKKFVEFMESEVELSSLINNSMDKFTYNIFKSVDSLEEYNKKFNKDLRLLFIRYGKEYF